MSDTPNPYATPRSRIEDRTDLEFESPRLFSRGRLGRVRYFGYLLALPLVIWIPGSIATVIVMNLWNDAPDVTVPVIYLGLAGGALYWLTLKRARDLNRSALFALLVFVPGAIMYYLFAPGVAGANGYGKPNPPNSAGEVAAIGIVVAIVAVLFLLALRF